MLGIIIGIVGLLIVVSVVFLTCPNFGQVPKGKSLERIKKSPNYYDGSFHNKHVTPQLTSGKSYFATAIDFLFTKKERLRPERELPVIQSDLWQMNREDDWLVWFGHSSYLLQVDGIRVLVDPVFIESSPLPFYNKPFKGPDLFCPKDIPEVDFLVISHDHWDHLDYKTVIALKDRMGKIICGLGVGEHFRRWGFDENRIIELDWDENMVFSNKLSVYCFPTRHFSGRGFSPNQSLWASYLIEFPSRKIYIGGDGGYDDRFTSIGEKFKDIDLAIMENGQYDENWKYIHLFPKQIIQAFQNLNAKTLFTVHHSKYTLANHPWDKPLNDIYSLAEDNFIPLLLPMIGEWVNLSDTIHPVKRWWDN
jgi:Predicted Zn-dependent hydrolases of the beta-lactamase fold